MKNAIAIVVIFFISLTFTLSTPASAEGKKKFTKKDLPAAVTAAFEKAYPDAVLKGASKEVEKGRTYYEIESVDGKVKRDLLYNPDGTVAEIEEGIMLKDLPDAVAKTLKSDYAKFKIEKSEKVTEGADVKYEFLVKRGKSRSEIVIDAAGKVVKTEKKGAAKEKEENEEDEK